MATSKYRLAEQVFLRLNGGYPDSSSSSKMDAIILEVGQVANGLVKASYATETLANGDTVPVATIIGIYSDIQVVPYKGVSKATLPTVPITLPKDQGIRQVGTNDDEYIQFIPMTQEAFILVRTENLISDLFGQIGYKREGFDLIFNLDLTTRPVPVKTIEAKLLVLDMDTLGRFDPMPIGADMESQVMEIVIANIAGRSLPSNTTTDLLENNQNKDKA